MIDDEFDYAQILLDTMERELTKSYRENFWFALKEVISVNGVWFCWDLPFFQRKRFIKVVYRSFWNSLKKDASINL